MATTFTYFRAYSRIFWVADILGKTLLVNPGFACRRTVRHRVKLSKMKVAFEVKKKPRALKEYSFYWY